MAHDLYYISVITGEIRKAKTSAGVSQRTPVAKVCIAATEVDIATLRKGITDIENVGSLQTNALTFKPAEQLEVSEILLDLSELPQKSA